MTTFTYDEMHERFLAWRGVETPCPVCDGSGVKFYSSTATWHGGIGGQACTKDVCDSCWGTGDLHRKGVDLRKQRNEFNSAVKHEVTKYLSNLAGISPSNARAVTVWIANEIEKLANKRKVPKEVENVVYWQSLCKYLAYRIRCSDPNQSKPE